VRNKNYVRPFGGIPAPPSYYDGVPMQAWGNGAAIPPPIFAVPNVAFAEPYAHLPQPQQNVATIAGYAQETCKLLQPSKPMQTKWVKEMQTLLGHLHLAPSDNSYEERRNLIMSKGTTTKTININHRRKIR
jgi:hypothetical protein